MIITCEIETAEKVIATIKKTKPKVKVSVAAVVLDEQTLQKLHRISQDDEEDFRGTLARIIDVGIRTLTRKKAGVN